ncbi:MAG: hypothetical protein IJX55_03115 [Clostridia bacterium]|nr:hypothetical protein [Clostridia bacterium]
MFGFVKPFVPLLRVSEYEFYRGAYCGLCAAMNKRTGAASSMTLSYDMVFFALVRGALTGERYILKKKRCAVHPIKKRTMMLPNGALDYTAQINAILVYYKFLDDAADERGAKKLASRALSSVAGGIKKRTQGLSELEAAVKASLGELSTLEKEKRPSPDEAAETFGKTLAICLSHGLPERKARIAWEIGRHTGRAVYLADAACDFWKDKKSGSYNPFVLALGGEMGEAEAQSVKNAVLLELAALERTLALIDYTEFDLTRECVMNVASFGIKNAFFSEFEKERSNDKSLHSPRD